MDNIEVISEPQIICPWCLALTVAKDTKDEMLICDCCRRIITEEDLDSTPTDVG